MIKTFGYLTNIEKDKFTIKINDLTKSEKNIVYKNLGSLVELNVDDGRKITNDQRKKIFALVNDIDAWSGTYEPKATRKVLQNQFLIEKEAYESISLSNCSITLASDFIEWLIVFCLNNKVEFATKTLDEVKGCYGWELHCLEAHVCCICGKPAQYAHWYSVGIGRNRNKINHVGNYIMALCHSCHSKQHNQGLITFINLNHLKGVKITHDLAIKLKIESEKTYQKSQNLSEFEYEREKSVVMYGDNYEYLEE